MEKSNVKYYRFSSGVVFKYDLDTLDFYVLNEEGVWEKNKYLISKFYDAASEYEEIDFDELDKKGKSR